MRVSQRDIGRIILKGVEPGGKFGSRSKWIVTFLVKGDGRTNRYLALDCERLPSTETVRELAARHAISVASELRRAEERDRSQMREHLNRPAPAFGASLGAAFKAAGL